MKRTTIKDELSAGRSVTYFTVGTSMQPLLSERETHVTIAPFKTAALGDILLYVRKDGMLVLHRLILVSGESFYMRGDNTYETEKVGKDQVIGTVTHIFRRGKEIDVKKNAAYKLYAAFWNSVFPIRNFYRRAKSYIRRRIK